MMLEEAISRACAEVGIKPPLGRIALRQWINTDTLGKNGKGDGRIICDDQRVTAFNWQDGSKATVWLKEERTETERKQYARDMRVAEEKARQREATAAEVARQIVREATPQTHPYLARKGFADEVVPVIGSPVLASILRRANKRPESLIAGTDGIVVAALTPGRRIASVQLIWEDGTKKFLAGGDMDGVHHRIAAGRDTWLCEGYATGLSLRAALHGLRRQDTILVCFSAANIAKVARTIKGRCFIAAENDKPLDHFGGIGTGEHYARQSGKPYAMPPELGMDVNDMHRRLGIFAVQRMIGDLVRRAA